MALRAIFTVVLSAASAALAPTGLTSQVSAQQAAPSSAPAPTASPPSQSAEARARREAEAHALFSAGASALAEGRYQDALVRFQQAYSLCGRAEILFNIGLAHDALGQSAEAAHAFEAYLRLSPDPSRREHAEARVKSLRAQPGAPAATTPPAPSAQASSRVPDKARSARSSKPSKRVVVAAPLLLEPIAESPLLKGL